MSLGGEYLTAMEEMTTYMNNLVSTYNGESSDADTNIEEFTVPSDSLNQVLTSDVVFSVTRTIAMHEGIDFVVSLGRAQQIFNEERSEYYASAIEECTGGTEESDKFKTIMQRYLEYGSTTVQD
jgi:hypothetical protein